MISNGDLEAFAQILIEIRDTAIRDLDTLKNMESARARRWAEVAATDPGNVLEHVIPECVDQVLSQVCQFIDDGRLRILWQPAEGSPIDMTVEALGDLAGWYAGEWRENAAQRFVPY